MSDPRFWAWTGHGSPDIVHDSRVYTATAAERPAGANVTAHRTVPGGWYDKFHFHPSRGDDARGFGRSLEVVGHHLLVGAPGAAPQGSPSGAVYVFDTRWR